MKIEEIRLRLEVSPVAPEPGTIPSPSTQTILESLFTDPYFIAEESIGVKRGHERYLQVVDVDGERFGYLEDRVPGGGKGAYFVRWVWDVDKIELGDGSEMWVVDDEEGAIDV